METLIIKYNKSLLCAMFSNIRTAITVCFMMGTLIMKYHKSLLCVFPFKNCHTCFLHDRSIDQTYKQEKMYMIVALILKCSARLLHSGNFGHISYNDCPFYVLVTDIKMPYLFVKLEIIVYSVLFH